jgi:DNA-binding IclR family transcriptional regulator
MNNSVLRAIGIVDALTKLGRPTALKDVAKVVGLNKVTTYRLLKSLCVGGVVQNIGDNGSYALGPACLKFAEGFRKSFTLGDRVRPYLERLVKATGETAIYCERYGFESCVTVERWDSPHDTRTFSGTGIIRPLSVGASALAILAMLPEAEVSAVISANKINAPATVNPVTRKEVAARIVQIKARHYAVSLRDRDVDTGSIAAPLAGDRGVVGSIAVIGPVDRMKRNGIQRIGMQVQRLAREFSGELRTDGSENVRTQRRSAG